MLFYVLLATMPLEAFRALYVGRGRRNVHFSWTGGSSLAQNNYKHSHHLWKATFKKNHISWADSEILWYRQIHSHRKISYYFDIMIVGFFLSFIKHLRLKKSVLFNIMYEYVHRFYKCCHPCYTIRVRH